MSGIFGRGRPAAPSASRSNPGPGGNDWDDEEWGAGAPSSSQGRGRGGSGPGPVPIAPLQPVLPNPGAGIESFLMQEREIPSSSTIPPPFLSAMPGGALPGTKTSTPNDCEILVFGKGDLLGTYAETLEKQIKCLGLKVDTMFPKADVSLPVFIEHLKTLGTAFAIVLTPEHVERKSVTLHALKAVPKPEEHRNMPLPACYKLLTDTIKEYRRIDFHRTPPLIRTNIERLLGHNYLTDMEYSSILKYIREQWERQRLIQERRDYDPDVGIFTTNELQQRILQILGAHIKESESDMVPTKSS